MTNVKYQPNTKNKDLTLKKIQYHMTQYSTCLKQRDAIQESLNRELKHLIDYITNKYKLILRKYYFIPHENNYVKVTIRLIGNNVCKDIFKEIFTETGFKLTDTEFEDYEDVYTYNLERKYVFEE